MKKTTRSFPIPERSRPQGYRYPQWGNPEGARNDRCSGCCGRARPGPDRRMRRL